MCKHFNLSWLDVRDDLTYFEYIALLLEASDAEELEDFNYTTLTAVAFHDPKRLKKWKFSGRDKAGTKKQGDVSQEIAKLVLSMSGGEAQVSGSEMAFADATGRVLYRTDDNKIVNKQGKVVEPAEDSIIIPMRKQ